MIYVILSTLISFAIVVLLTPKFIPFLQRLKMGQTIRELGPKSHYKKAGTPTMGGLVMMLGILVTCALFFTKADGDLIFALFVTLIFGLIGFLDDYIKMVQKNRLNSEGGVLVPYLGMLPIQKLLLQFSAAGAVAVYAAFHPTIGTSIVIPFTNIVWNMGIFYIPFVIIAIVAVVNAANLTDGLDGLACGVTMIILFFFLVFSLVIVSIFTRSELYILIAGGIYLIEALSVILQVFYFKKTGGKRLFKMAPIHHHFELLGHHETKIVTCFWITTAVLVLISLLSLPIMFG